MTEKWISEAEVNRLSWVESRNRLAEGIACCDVDDILKKYVLMSRQECRELLSNVFDQIGVVLKGIGVEIGAGVSGISCTVGSLFPAVERIYAVEIVPQVVALLQTKVVSAYGLEGKIQPVVGSFDELHLESGSIDFIIEFDSLHHSFDLAKTVREVHRVLKPGGLLIALDRSHDRFNSRKVLDRLLAAVYPPVFLKEHGFSENAHFTRAMNGEHEYYDEEWTDSFLSSGFKSVKRFYFFRPSLRHFAFSCIVLAPNLIRQFTRYKNLAACPIHKMVGAYITFQLLGWRKYKHFRKLDLPNFAGRYMSKTVFVVEK